MESLAESRQQPSVGKADRIFSVIGCVIAAACILVVLHAIGSNLPFLLDIGEVSRELGAGLCFRCPSYLRPCFCFLFRSADFGAG